MGRRKLAMPDEARLRFLYNRFQSVREVAKMLGLPKERVRLALVEYGITRQVQMKIAAKSAEDEIIKIRPSICDEKDYGPIPTWLRDNPLKKLPRNATAIAEIIGVSGEAVRSYFYRLRRKMIAKLSSLPDISFLDLEMVSIDDEVVSTRSFKSYEYRVDYYSMFVSIIAKLEDGSTAVFEITDLPGFERVLADEVQELSPSDQLRLKERQIALRDQRALRKARSRLSSNHHDLQSHTL